MIMVLRSLSKLSLSSSLGETKRVGSSTDQISYYPFLFRKMLAVLHHFDKNNVRKAVLGQSLLEGMEFSFLLVPFLVPSLLFHAPCLSVISRNKLDILTSTSRQRKLRWVSVAPFSMSEPHINIK